MQEKADDEITLKEVILKIKDWRLYIFSKWKIIVLTGLLGASLGLLYAFTRKPLYTATLTFVLEDEKSRGGMGALSLAGQLGIDLGGSSGGVFSGANLLELMVSRTLVEKTLLNPITYHGKTKSFAEFYSELKKWRSNWDNNPKLKKIRFLPNADRTKFLVEQDSILGVMYENIVAENLDVSQKTKQSGIVVINVKSGNEVFSKYFAEALAREVSNFYIETKSKKAKLNVDILVKQMDSVKIALNNAIVGVATANDNTFNLNSALNINRVPSVRKQVDVQANTAILTELVKNLEMAKLTLRKETPLIQIIDAPILPLKKQKFGKMRGIQMGGLLGGILAIAWFSLRRFWLKLMGEETSI